MSDLEEQLEYIELHRKRIAELKEDVEYWERKIRERYMLADRAAELEGGLKAGDELPSGRILTRGLAGG